jgi:hypothetical protein
MPESVTPAASRHLVQRIDALPPWADLTGRRYWCPTCGHLTHTQITDTPSLHEIAAPGRWITADDVQPASESGA